MDSMLTLHLPRETLAALAAERMRTGMSFEETVREALRALALVAGNEPRREAELAS
jgi:hypothetical protein